MSNNNFYKGHPSYHTPEGNRKISLTHKGVPETEIAKAHQRKKKSNNTSGYLGVHQRGDNGCYRVSFTIDHVRYQVGQFSDPRTAWLARELFYRIKMISLGLGQYIIDAN